MRKYSQTQILILVVLLGLLIFVGGCKTVSTTDAPKQVYAAAWDKNKNGAKYTELTVKALEQYGNGLMALVSVNDAKKYCPNFEKLSLDQKKAFYVLLISSVAQYESDFNTDEKYTEGFDDVQGNKVVSRGLLQISQESANQKAYGCDIKQAQDLHIPEVNLNCAVKILNHWITQDKVIGTNKLGGARYWAVLRESSHANSKIMESVSTSELCKWH